MGDHQHGHTGRRLFLEHLEDLHAGAEVELTGGLVGQQDRIAGGEGPGDGHPLLLATRQLVGEVAEPVAEPDASERLGGPFAGVGPRWAASAPNCTFSNAVRPGKRLKVWKMKLDRVAPDLGALASGTRR